MSQADDIACASLLMTLYVFAAIVHAQDTRGHPGGYCCLIELAKDPIANYVVNKAIEVSESDQRGRILELIFSSRQELVRQLSP